MNQIQALQQFSERVLRITPTYRNVMGSVAPGATGHSAAGGMGANASTEITLQLKSATAQLLQQVETGQPVEVITTSEKAIEGLLMSEVVIGMLSEQEAYGLIDTLQDIMEIK